MFRSLKPALVFLLLGALLASCTAGQEPKARYTIFKYEDFGPQAMAYELIGMQWWQGDGPAPAVYDIKVVIHRGLALDGIKERYPVTREAATDYRYVTYNDAIAFLDRHIEEDVLPSVTAMLQRTRTRLKLGFSERSGEITTG